MVAALASRPSRHDGAIRSLCRAGSHANFDEASVLRSQTPALAERPDDGEPDAQRV